LPERFTLHPGARKQIFLTAVVYRQVTTSQRWASNDPTLLIHRPRDPTYPPEGWDVSIEGAKMETHGEKWRHDHTEWGMLNPWVRIQVSRRSAMQKPPAHSTTRRPHFWMTTR